MKKILAVLLTVVIVLSFGGCEKKCKHKSVSERILTEATCTEPGDLRCTCDVCGEIWHEVIPPKGHNPVVDEAVEATEESTGLTEGSHCSVCGAIIVKQKVIPKIDPYELPQIPI